MSLGICGYAHINPDLYGNMNCEPYISFLLYYNKRNNKKLYIFLPLLMYLVPQSFVVSFSVDNCVLFHGNMLFNSLFFLCLRVCVQCGGPPPMQAPMSTWVFRRNCEVTGRLVCSLVPASRGMARPDRDRTVESYSNCKKIYSVQVVNYIVLCARFSFCLHFIFLHLMKNTEARPEATSLGKS